MQQSRLSVYSNKTRDEQRCRRVLVRHPAISPYFRYFAQLCVAAAIVLKEIRRAGRYLPSFFMPGWVCVDFLEVLIVTFLAISQSLEFEHWKRICRVCYEIARGLDGNDCSAKFTQTTMHGSDERVTRSETSALGTQISQLVIV